MHGAYEHHTPQPFYSRSVQKHFVVVVVVAFTLNPSLYPTTLAVHLVSVLILHLRETQILWPQTVKQRKTKQNVGESK